MARADDRGATGAAEGWWADPRRQELRISDADRRAVADLLAEHFAEGRLDTTEHQERMGRAMAARTGADLAPLLVDLPRPADLAPPPPRRRRRLWPVGALVLVVVLAATSVGGAVHAHVGLLLVGLLVLALVRRRRSCRRAPVTGASGTFPTR